MIVTDIAIILMLVYAGFVGVRRGFLLVACELIAFVIALGIALGVYHLFGRWLSSWLGISIGLADVAGFMVVWIVIEIICALLVHRFLIHRITPRVQRSRANRVGGAAAGVLRSLILIALALIIFAGLPLSAAAKQPVVGSLIGGAILRTTGGLQSGINAGLGHDLNASLTIFTVTNDPESTERVRLGFTTTDVKLDPADEDAMLALVNHERTSRGLVVLRANPTAQAVARAYAKRMLADGVFSHIDNDGHDPFARMRAGHVSFGAAGENLALAPTLQLAHQGLMNSPGHRANILSTNYRTVGIGIVDAGQYGLMVVQDFTD